MVRMMVLDALHHVAVTVTDVDRARRFYSEVLGLTEIPRPDFGFGGVWYRVGNSEVHLIAHAETRTMRGITTIDSRDGHFALRVGRYDETLAHLRALGVPCLELPVNKTPWAQLYVTDPDGNVIELNAPPETVGPAA